MTYIIENVQLYKHNQFTKTSLLVDDGKILALQPSFSKYQYMKMNAENFIMTPTHVFYCEWEKIADQLNKKLFINRYVFQGCTTVVISTKTIFYIHEIDEAIEEIKSVFDNSCLDFVIVIRIPIDALTVQMVQKCKRERIPAILVEFENRKQLYKIPWGWIREALFPYNCPLVPVINHEDPTKFLNWWNTILSQEKIPHIESPLEENTPLALDLLKKMGIYPMKGYLQAGGELTYNLYLPKSTTANIENPLKEAELTITVHQGDIIRAGKTVFYNPEKGEQLLIKRPSFFK